MILVVLAGLAAVYATGQVTPATSAHQGELRVWLAARAAGFVTLGLLTLQVALGLILSHPDEQGDLEAVPPPLSVAREHLGVRALRSSSSTSSRS